MPEGVLWPHEAWSLFYPPERGLFDFRKGFMCHQRLNNASTKTTLVHPISFYHGFGPKFSIFNMFSFVSILVCFFSEPRAGVVSSPIGGTSTAVVTPPETRSPPLLSPFLFPSMTSRQSAERSAYRPCSCIASIPIEMAFSIKWCFVLLYVLRK